MGTVQQYQENFEELKSIIRKINPGSSEAYFVSSFISSLNDELRPCNDQNQSKRQLKVLGYK